MVDIPTYNELYNFVVEQMTNNQWFQTVGFFGVLGVIWQYTRKLPEYLWNRLKRKVTYTANIEETDEFYSYFEDWLNTNHKSCYRNVQVTTTANRTYNSYDKTYSNDFMDEKELREQEEKLKYKQFQDVFFIWRGLQLIRIFKGREQLQNASKISDAYYNHFKISGLFAKKAILNMLQEVLDLKVEQEKAKRGVAVGVWTNNKDYWQKEEDFEPKVLSNIILPNKEEVVADIEKFIEAESWYKQRGIPFKRGYMFKGRPGNGKTTLAIALAKYFGKDLYVMNPSGVSDSELRELFRALTKKSILLIEDVDTTFNKNRDKKENDIKFNFSTLLNCIDGVFSKEGVIVIFTTNHPEALDKALIRKGRIDLEVLVDNPTNESIIKYLNLFFGTNLTVDLDKDYKNISMSHVQELCLKNKTDSQAALKEIKEVILSKHQLDKIS